MKYDSRWESEYTNYLTIRKLSGEISDFIYSPFKIILGDRLTYLPDFLVILPNGTHQIHEVKGFQREDSVVKFKAAAAKYPFWEFMMVSKVGGNWQLTRVLNSDTLPDKPKPKPSVSAPAPARAKLSYAQMLQNPEYSRILNFKPYQIRNLRGNLSYQEVSEITGILPLIWQNLETGTTKLYHYNHVIAIQGLLNKQ